MILWWTGKQLDRDYRSTRREQGLSAQVQPAMTSLDFPIEKARLRSVWYPLAIAIVGTAGYGWSLRRRVVSSSFLSKWVPLTKRLAYCRAFDSPIHSWQHAPSLLYGNFSPRFGMHL